MGLEVVGSLVGRNEGSTVGGLVVGSSVGRRLVGSRVGRGVGLSRG